MATTDDRREQIEAKVITGWLQQLGLKIKLSVVDSGTLTYDIYNAARHDLEPDFDLSSGTGSGCFDPGQTLVCLTTPQIGNLDEPYWSNAQYDKLAREQAGPSIRSCVHRSSGRCSRSCTGSRPGSR